MNLVKENLKLDLTENLIKISKVTADIALKLTRILHDFSL